MTDKQINKFSDLTFTQLLGCELVATCNNTRKVKELQEQLKAKEQECEDLKDKLNCCFCNPHVELNDIEKQRKCVEVTECFRRQLDQLKAENERLKQFENDANYILKKQLDLFDKKEQALTEIKPILEFYANSKLGEEQPDRTYKIMLNGGYIMAYDPKPAREALRKINEVEDERI